MSKTRFSGTTDSYNIKDMEIMSAPLTMPLIPYVAAWLSYRHSKPNSALIFDQQGVLRRTIDWLIYSIAMFEPDHSPISRFAMLIIDHYLMKLHKDLVFLESIGAEYVGFVPKKDKEATDEH